VSGGKARSGIRRAINGEACSYSLGSDLAAALLQVDRASVFYGNQGSMVARHWHPDQICFIALDL
jgi:hypothetical protein